MNGKLTDVELNCKSRICKVRARPLDNYFAKSALEVMSDHKIWFGNQGHEYRWGSLCEGSGGAMEAVGAEFPDGRGSGYKIDGE